MTADPFPDGFPPTARLFPLPNLVFFPGVVQGLHIFEPRYRQMMADALAGDGRIALVLLSPGWTEETYEGRPAIESVACLGRVGWHERLPDGRYNLRLHGQARVRILEEVPTDRLYRTARVERVPETAPADPDELRARRAALADAVLPRFGPGHPAREQLRGLFDGELSLGQVCDVLAYALPVPVGVKQALLAEPDAVRRAAALAGAAGAPDPADRRFPPDFSPN
ncbi:MAG: peptidase S16 [Isosphaera sp.]|nr:peptidase S16 [Isosphaera sp.]